eukprot:6672274-Pyramimonas_sp.AAC.1
MAQLELGEMSNLEALQMEGNELEYPGLNLYRKDPLLLMLFHNVSVIRLDLTGARPLQRCGSGDRIVQATLANPMHVNASRANLKWWPPQA